VLLGLLAEQADQSGERAAAGHDVDTTRLRSELDGTP
jgi:hypothetical protein